MKALTKIACLSAATLCLSSASIQSVVAGTTPTPMPMEASLICRQAYANEVATATLASNSTALVCRPLSLAMRASDGSVKIIGDVKAKPLPGPDFSKALTPQQVQDACEHWVETLFHISHTS